MPYFFNKAFAENGDITLIPRNDQGDGFVSFETGWGEGYELNPNIDPDEARNLSRTNFNGLFFNITSVLRQFQKFGVNPYITSSDNDGVPYTYDKGGLCSYIDPDTNDYGVYYSIRDNNATLPSENGITNKFWQRIFQAGVEPIKSNRLRNAVLYKTEDITYEETTNEYTFTIPTGIRVLFSNGYNSDGSFNNELTVVSNNLYYSLNKENLNGAYFFMLTSNDTLLVLDSNQYTDYQNEDEIIVEKGEKSTFDVYYFNSEENKWKKRNANSTEFYDLDYSLCLLAIVYFNNDVLTSFETENVLEIVSAKELNDLLSRKQNTLITGNFVNIEPTNTQANLISVELPPKTTPFCINSCNMDSEGEIDLLYTDSVVNTGVMHNMISEFGTNGVISQGGDLNVVWSDPENAFGTDGTSNNAYISTTAGLNGTCSLTFTLTTPLTITQECEITLDHMCSYYTYSTSNGRRIRPGIPISSTVLVQKGSFLVVLVFDDNTEQILYSSGDILQNQVWKNYTISVPSSCIGKTIKSIRIDHYIYNNSYVNTNSRRR